MKNENAIMDRIKARIAYHANEHRHTYEIGKGVMDFLARDLLADFKAAGGLFPPVALDGDVYVIYRRKPVKAKVIFIGINADRLFFFNVLRGNIKANFQTYQFTWVKRNRKSPSWFWGLGNWTRANAEICLLATKGKPKRASASVHSIIDAPIGRHSEKPAETRDRIVQLAGGGSMIELFARKTAPGWDSWGDEVEGGETE